MTLSQWASAAVGAIVAIYALDRFLCWCELRGWICYRLTPRQRRSLGAAAFQVESLLQPEKRHVYELREDAAWYREDKDESGGQTPDSKSKPN